LIFMKPITMGLVTASVLFILTPGAHAQEATTFDRPGASEHADDVQHRHRFSIAPKALYFFSSESAENFSGAGLDATFFLSERFALKADGDLLSIANRPTTLLTTYTLFSPPFEPVNEARAKAMFGAEFVAVRARGSLVHGNGNPMDVTVGPRVGAIWTRPISVYDPEHRYFSYRPDPAFELDVGARVYVSPSVALTLDAGWLLYREETEDESLHADRSDPSEWYNLPRFRTGALVQLGIALLTPPTSAAR
jgi:hypothetical protein